MPVAIASISGRPQPSARLGKQQDIAGIVKVREVIVGQFAIQICRVADAGLLHLGAQLGQIVFIGIFGSLHQIKAVRLQQSALQLGHCRMPSHSRRAVRETPLRLLELADDEHTVNVILPDLA